MNIILLVLEVLIVLGIIYFLYKKLNKNGLYLFIIIGLILLNVFTLKTIEILSIDITTGIVINIAIYTISIILVHKYGFEELKKLIFISAMTLLFSYIIISLSGMLESGLYNDLSNEAYNIIFASNIRLFIANITSILFGIWINGLLYYKLKGIKNIIFINNILTTIIIQFIDNIIFTVLAYMVTTDIVVLIGMFLIRYIIKVLIGIIFTILIYMIDRIKEKI